MRGKPPKTVAELRNLLPVRPPINGGQIPTRDPGHPDLDTHKQPDDLFGDPRSRADGKADKENRDLADAFKAVFKASRKPVDNDVPRFVFTWRMYPNGVSTVVGTEGNCGCGCSCGG